MKKFNQFVNIVNKLLNEGEEIGKKPAQQDDEDLDYLNRLLGNAPDTPIVEDDGILKKGSKITYYKDGSDYDGKSGTFVDVKEDGKFSLRFDDGKRFAANAKNVYPLGEKKPQPKKKLPEGYNEIPEDKIGVAKWGPGAFELPDTFYGKKGAPEVKKGKIVSDGGFKKGDKIVYRNSKSEHDGKSGSIIEKREDGKFSIRFDDGKRFAANPGNISSQSGNMAKNGFILKIGNLPPNQDFMEDYSIGIMVMLDDGAVYDGELVYQFPELGRVGIEEGPGEGILLYTGDLTKEELAEDLKERDYRVEVINGNLW